MRLQRSILAYSGIILLLGNPALSFSTSSRATSTTRNKISKNGFPSTKPLNSPTSRLLPKFSTLKISTFTFTKSPSSSSTQLSSTLATLGASIGLDAAVAGASLAATAKLLSSIGLGGLAAKKDNLLDAAAISALSRLSYGVFQPAFLIVSIASTLCNTAMSTGGSGMPRQLLGLSFFASAFNLMITFLVGKVITKVARFQGDEAKDVQMCVTFQNCGPLPLVFAETLFSGSLLADVTACISFYLLAWSPLFWSVGRMIVGTYGESDASVSLPKRVVNEVEKFLSPPVVGALIGLVIGSVPFLRRAFFGGWASPLFGALKTLGMAYLPSALLVLAGSLVVKKPALMNGVEKMTTHPHDGSTGPSLKAAVAIMLARFGIAPLLALTSVRVYEYFGWLGVGRAKAVVTFCLLMQGCMPPAQNLVLLYSLAGLKERGSVMAKMLALMYALSVVPVTILLSYCLSISGIAAFR